MKRLILVLLGLASVCGAAASQAADWSALPALPQPRYGAAGAAAGGAFRVLGGHDAEDLAVQSVWSPEATAWSEGAPLSEQRLYAAAATSGEALFVIGGLASSGWPLASVARLDPGSGQWSAAAALPAGRDACGAAALDGFIYVAGGESDYGLMPAAALRYDVAHDTWGAIAALPTPRTGPAMAAFGGRIYVIGGIGTGAPLAVVEVFDPAGGTWSPGPALPEPLWQPAAAAFDGRLWVAGGRDASFAPTTHVYSLGADGAWRAEAPLPVALASAVAIADQERLIVASGRGVDGPLAGAYEMLAAPAPPPPPPPPQPPTTPETLAVTITFEPPTLNAASRGKWISAWLDAPDWPIADLDVGSLTLLDTGVAADAPTSLGDADGDGRLERMVKFPRAAFTALPSGPHIVCVAGYTTGGTPVAGCGFIEVRGGTVEGKRPEASRPHGLTLKVPTGRIVFGAEEPVVARLEVLDVQGRIVERIFAGVLVPGEQVVAWPTRGHSVPAGIYFARLRWNGGQVTAKVSVTR